MYERIYTECKYYYEKVSNKYDLTRKGLFDLNENLEKMYCPSEFCGTLADTNSYSTCILKSLPRFGPIILSVNRYSN